MEKTGKAYGLFNCNASKAEIEGSLRDIREYVQTPTDIDFRLTTMDEFAGDARSPRELVDLIKKAKIYAIFPESMRDQIDKAKPIKARSLKYVIEATGREGDNEVVARSTGEVLNGLYQIYDQGRAFEGTTVYRDGHDYIMSE